MTLKRLQKSAFCTQSVVLQASAVLPILIEQLEERKLYNKDLFSTAIAALNPLLVIGYSLDNLAGLLTHLKRPQLKQALEAAQSAGTDLVLTCPIHYAITAPQYHYISIPAQLQQPWQDLARWSHLTQSQKEDTWLLSGPDSVITPTQRFNWIKRGLRNAFRIQAKSLSQTTLPKGLTLNQYSRALCNQAMIAGCIEPAIITLRQSSPLPVDADPSSYQLLRGLYIPPLLASEWRSLQSLKEELPASPTHARLREYMKQRQIDHRGLYHEVFTDSERCKPDEPHWDEDTLSPSLLCSNTPDFRSPSYEESCVQLINAFFEILLKDNPADRRLTPKRAERFLDLALDFLWTNELVFQPHSIALLSLGWITELLCDAKINPSTARKYISQLVTRTGIHFELSHDVRLWDDDDLESFIGFVDRRLGSGQSTKIARAHQIVRFFKFCGSLGLLQDAALPKVDNGFITTRKRNHLVEPYRIHNLVNYSALNLTERDLAMSSTVILAYYGGLRHDEVARLRLSHFQRHETIFANGQFGEGASAKVRVTVARGKTLNSPRSLYLHLLADPAMIDRLLRVLEQRQALFPTAHPKNIRMNGVTKDRLGYRSKKLKQRVIKKLKEQLGHDIDVHTLRHNFATWLILAYELAKNPDMAQYFNVWQGPSFLDSCQLS